MCPGVFHRHMEWSNFLRKQNLNSLMLDLHPSPSGESENKDNAFIMDVRFCLYGLLRHCLCFILTMLPFIMCVATICS